jgi:hypothetical protein
MPFMNAEGKHNSNAMTILKAKERRAKKMRDLYLSN